MRGPIGRIILASVTSEFKTVVNPQGYQPDEVVFPRAFVLRRSRITPPSSSGY